MNNNISVDAAASHLSTNHPLTIAWMLQGDEGFGVARAVESLAAQLDRMGRRPIFICCIDGPMASRGDALGFKVVRLNLERAPDLAGGVIAKALGVWRLRRFRRRIVDAVGQAFVDSRVDVVHCLWPSFVGIVGGVAERLGAQPVWEMPNAMNESLWGLNRRYYLGLCRRYGVTVLANSAYTAATLGKAAGVRRRLMHLGVDSTIFNPGRVEPLTRAALNLPDKAVVFGIVARLDASKGADRFLQAMLNVAAKDDEDLHLLLIGGPVEGAYAKGLLRLAEGAGQSHRLHMPGQVDHPERYYGAMDIAVNSRVDPEPFGLSVIEAMMMGVPVLVHALGGPAETVLDGQTGWHVSAPDVEAFESGIRRVLSDRPRWPQFSMAARSRAMENFNVKRQAELYLDFLESR